jgi:hypothetical protein
MDKEQLLTSVYREETSSKSRRSVSASDVLYYIGGGIVFLGISVLIWQNWAQLNFFSKILATLGAALACYIVGILFQRREQTNGIRSAFHLISALTFPIGFYVLFDQLNLNPNDVSMQLLVSGFLLVFYLISLFFFRKTVFTLFSIIFGSWFYFSLTSFILRSGPSSIITDFQNYQILTLGLCYLLLAWAFSEDSSKGQYSLTGALNGFGSLFFLGAAMALGGWKPNQNIFWELFFPVIVFFFIFSSLRAKSKVLLTFGAIFLMIYILKITAEYFTTGLGWPLALVIAGLLLIAIGYGTFHLRKKYII